MGVGSLYNQVDELVHKLVTLSNKCTQELEFIMEFKSLEEGFREVRVSLYTSSSNLQAAALLKYPGCVIVNHYNKLISNNLFVNYPVLNYKKNFLPPKTSLNMSKCTTSAIPNSRTLINKRARHYLKCHFSIQVTICIAVFRVIILQTLITDSHYRLSSRLSG